MKEQRTRGQIIAAHTLTYFNFLNIALFVLIVISGQYKNGLFMGVIISNSLIGIIQEFRIKKLIDNLSVITATKARLVTKEGIKEIPIEQIKVDNMLRIAIGDQIACDGVVDSSDGLEVNESLLTGESMAVHKNKGDKVFSGSLVVAGSATINVTHVGDDSYAVELAKKARSKKRANSEMQTAIKKIIKYVSFAIVPIGITLFCMQYIRLGASLSQSLVSTVAGVVGMIPEGLVLLTSISFILGVGRLARKRALVQEMEAIEALARVNVLCLDKTGTITTGDLKVKEIFNIVDGDYTEVLSSFSYAFDDTNATSDALQRYFDKSNAVTPDASIPFSSHRKFMGISIKNTNYVLGAPDFICKDEKIIENINTYSKRGLRVLMLAKVDTLVDSPDKLTDVAPLCFITLEDCIKENAPEILGFFANQGVAVRIISGDNPATVSSVAIDAGLKDADKYVDATTLSTSADELKKAVHAYTVFGRVSPEMKQAIIKAYQDEGFIVGMVGDGVNDCLALKDSDCGIAMANGADAAKQTAHIVLLDSDFGSMKDIVREGRTIIANIERVSALYLTKTIYSVLLCILFIILKGNYPFIPIQLTLISATTIGIPSFFLALEHHEEITTSGFLKHVLKISLPAAVLLVTVLGIIQWLASAFALSSIVVSTLNLLAGGLTGLGVLFAVSFPLTKARTALLVATSCIFAGAILFFPQFFNVLKIF